VEASPTPPRRAGNKEIFRDSAVAREAKITAPVQLQFTSTPSGAGVAGANTVVLTLTVRALTDIPSGVARVVLPAEVKLLSGQREVEFGALRKGDERQFVLTVDATASSQAQIFAGVDCHISSGIQLHKEARPIFLGQAPTGTPN
jgi:hypothetical protein